MQNWNSHHELDRASISNFKAPGLKMKEGNCSKLFIISDGYPFVSNLQKYMGQKTWEELTVEMDFLFR